GRVKFFKSDKGWGGIESSDTPADVWVHFKDIDAAGFRSLEAGEIVEFRWEPAIQDSWRCRATWVRAVGSSTLRVGPLGSALAAGGCGGWARCRSRSRAGILGVCG